MDLVGDVNHMHREYVLEDSDCNVRQAFNNRMFVLSLLEVGGKYLVKKVALSFFLLYSILIV